ncbi:MAG: PqqD family protein [Pseudomonadota bacterium]
MSATLFSANWFRVAGLRPRLRGHARFTRHLIRGAPWFVLQDGQSGRHHRLSPEAYHIASLLDGRRTVDEAWEATVAWTGAEAEPPTQDDVIELLAQLHSADLLAGDAPPDIEELTRRSDRLGRQKLLSRFKNPLALRFPLVDPDRFLTATAPLARWIFTWVGLLLWLALVAAGGATAVLHWGALTDNIAERVLAAESLLLFALVYPAIKAVHELAHGYAVKVWGGEVREMGIMILVLFPVPYVDASAASAFPGKWRRAVVSGAGIMAELAVAAAAMLVWASAEPGLVRAAAFNAALIGGVSTLLFNGNPLLRFDGYYVFADLVEIPNLAQRANKQVFHLIKRHAFGLRESRSAVTARGEAVWLVVYSLAAFAYRIVIVLGIALFIAGQFFVLGVLLAMWSVGSAFVWPLLKGLWWLADAAELRGRRARAVAASAAAAGGIAALLFAVPLPWGATAQGVVHLPQEALLRAQTDGFVTAAPARPPGARAAEGEALLRLEDPILIARTDVLRAERDELALRLAQETTLDPAQSALLREQLGHAEAALTLNLARREALNVRAPREGAVWFPGAADLAGRFVRRGDLLGYVVREGDAVLRTAVPQADADLVRRRTQAVSVRLADAPEAAAPSRLLRMETGATTDLPSAALTSAAGGALAADPASGDGRRSLEPVFLVDVALPEGSGTPAIGLRGQARFDLGDAPLGRRALRALRQLFLTQFDV